MICILRSIGVKFSIIFLCMVNCLFLMWLGMKPRFCGRCGRGMKHYKSTVEGSNIVRWYWKCDCYGKR